MARGLSIHGSEAVRSEQKIAEWARQTARQKPPPQAVRLGLQFYKLTVLLWQ